jgi:hypothetical protein
MLENLKTGKQMKSPQIRLHCESCNTNEYAFYLIPEGTNEIKIFACQSCNSKFSSMHPVNTSNEGAEEFRKFFEVIKAVDA